jgi:quercetin dioxygenase-like cupin family protein
MPTSTVVAADSSIVAFGPSPCCGEMGFGEAMQVVLKGGKVTRECWGDSNATVQFGQEYVFMRADVVHLHKADGSEHKLIVGSGDVSGEDWVEID